MDDARFDRLARAWSAAGTRRRLFGLLAALPALGGLAESVAAGDVDGTGSRRNRRKKRHKHGKGRRRKGHRRKPKLCRPESRATTCAGRCGAVKNTCKQTIECGSCACDPPCTVCQTCEDGPNTPGVCVPNPHLVGEVCGAGQVCRDDGACTCDADSCAACETCQEDGVCAAPCDGEGCCADGSCLSGDTIDACGIDGESCQVCAEDEFCWNGRCVCGDVCADGCQFATIQEAVEDVAAGSTLRLCAETYAGVSIHKDLTLLGVGDGEGGTVLDGRGRGGVVVIAPGASVVTLQGLRITGGDRPRGGEDGGGIYHAGERLTLIACTVTGNSAADEGGGIHIRGHEVSLINCRVTGNSAGIQGGGIHNRNSEPLTIQDSVISGNTAGHHGGGIFSRGNLTIINSEITDNVADMEGGGLSTGDFATLTDCLVTGNTATTGGGIFHISGTLSLTTSQITANTADEGGGIYNDDAAVTLTDSTVEDNTPDNCSGEPIVGCSG